MGSEIASLAGTDAQLQGRHTPRLGEHNPEMIRELGYSDTEIEAPRKDGVIGTVPAGAGM